VDSVSLDVHAEDVAGDGLGLSRALGQPHTARLAAATNLDLGLHHDDTAAEFLRHLAGRRGVMNDTAPWHRHPVRGEQLLGLVLEQVHEGTVLDLWDSS